MSHTPEPGPGTLASTGTCRTCGGQVEELMGSCRPDGRRVPDLDSVSTTSVAWWHTATLDELTAKAGGAQHG